jgi:hypothetical protein
VLTIPSCDARAARTVLHINTGMCDAKIVFVLTTRQILEHLEVTQPMQEAGGGWIVERIDSRFDRWRRLRHFSPKPFASSLHQIKQITEQGLVVPSHDLGAVSAVHGAVFRVANAIGTCSDCDADPEVE